MNFLSILTNGFLNFYKNKKRVDEFLQHQQNTKIERKKKNKVLRC